MSNIRTYEITHCEQKLFPIQQKDSTDYFIDGSLVMKNGKIDKVLFDGGYAQASVVSNTTKDKFAFNFYNQDHLGNNREVVDAKGVVQQVTNYYLFGAPYADATVVKNANFQQYKYNGKELDRVHGLNPHCKGNSPQIKKKLKKTGLSKNYSQKQILRFLSKYKKVRSNANGKWESVTMLKYISEICSVLDI